MLRKSVVGERWERGFHAQVLAALEQRRDEMYQEANAACERYWDENIRRRQGPLEGRLRYLPRVRLRSVGVTIDWLRMKSFWSPKQKRAIPRYETVARGKGYQVPIEKFTGATKEELDMIVDVEQKVEALRLETEWAVQLKNRVNTHPYRVRRQRAAALEKAVAEQVQQALAKQESCSDDGLGLGA